MRGSGGANAPASVAGAGPPPRAGEPPTAASTTKLSRRARSHASSRAAVSGSETLPASRRSRALGSIGSATPSPSPATATPRERSSDASGPADAGGPRGRGIGVRGERRLESPASRREARERRRALRVHAAAEARREHQDDAPDGRRLLGRRDEDAGRPEAERQHGAEGQGRDAVHWLAIIFALATPGRDAVMLWVSSGDWPVLYGGSPRDLSGGSGEEQHGACSRSGAPGRGDARGGPGGATGRGGRRLRRALRRLPRRRLEGGQAKSLLDDEWKYGGDDASVTASIRDGRLDAGMPPFGAAMSEQEIRALVIFIRERADEARRAKTVYAKPQRRHGREERRARLQGRDRR